MTGDYETLAGLVIAEFGGLPSVGDTVQIGAPGSSPHLVQAEVRAVERHVPASLFVTACDRMHSDE